MLNYEEALASRNEHSFIIGAAIKSNIRIMGEVVDLIVAPFDGINQHRFLKEYKQQKDATKALSFYRGNLYTVLLVVKPLINQTQLFTIELEDYLQSNIKNHLSYA